MQEKDIVTRFYNSVQEEERLSPKHGQIEFLTTMRYIHRYLKPGMRVLEVGAGTDRASRYMEDTVDRMDEKIFSAYLEYHFLMCERGDLLGASNHTLDVLRRQ